MYIHQLAGWPEFHWDSNVFAGVLSQARFSQGLILGQMRVLGFRIQEEAFLRNLTLEVVKSSEIEGEILNVDQVRSSIAKRLGIEVAGEVTASRDVEGVVEMMLDATQNFANPLTEERLFGWHASLFPTGYSGMSKIKTGEWRDGPMQVVSGFMGKERVHFEAPSADRVPEEMQRFLSWFNTEQEIEPLLKAAVAHFWFVTILPFDDGNGRIARAIADMLLADADGTNKRFCSMSAQIQKERKAYYDILESSQKGDLDITPWLLWFIECLNRSMSETLDVLSKALERRRFWDKYGDEQFNQRQRKMLQTLLDDFFGKLNVSKWAKMTSTSTDTALRDIKDLVERGILIQEGNGRSTSYRIIEL